MMLKKAILSIGLLAILAGFVAISVLPQPAYAQEENPKTCLVKQGDSTGISPDNVAPCLSPSDQTFPWIVDGWRWSLSLVNVFATIVLIVMAFANILYPWQQLESYRIRQLLPTFIAGVILANASLFIVRAIVSVADMLMGDGGFQVSLAQLFTAWGFNPQELSNGIIQSSTTFQFKPDDGVGTMLFKLIAATALIYIPMAVLAFLAFIFYIRFAVIFLFTVISPLAFGSIIFPATRQYLGRWWDTFWKWTFGGVGSYFILRLAAQVKPINDTAGQANFAIQLLPYIISIALLYLAAITPFKLGGAIAGAYAKIAGWAGKKSFGAAKKTAGWGKDKAFGYGSNQFSRNLVQANEAYRKNPTAWNRLKYRTAQGMYDATHFRANRQAVSEQRQAHNERIARQAGNLSGMRLSGIRNISPDAEHRYLRGLSRERAGKLEQGDLYERLQKSQNKSLLESLTPEQLLGLMTGNQRTVDQLHQNLGGRMSLQELHDLGADVSAFQKAAFIARAPGDTNQDWLGKILQTAQINPSWGGTPGAGGGSPYGGTGGSAQAVLTANQVTVNAQKAQAGKGPGIQTGSLGGGAPTAFSGDSTGAHPNTAHSASLDFAAQQIKSGFGIKGNEYDTEVRHIAEGMNSGESIEQIKQRMRNATNLNDLLARPNLDTDIGRMRSQVNNYKTRLENEFKSIEAPHLQARLDAGDVALHGKAKVAYRLAKTGSGDASGLMRNLETNGNHLKKAMEHAIGADAQPEKIELVKKMVAEINPSVAAKITNAKSAQGMVKTLLEGNQAALAISKQVGDQAYKNALAQGMEAKKAAQHAAEKAVQHLENLQYSGGGAAAPANPKSAPVA